MSEPVVQQDYDKVAQNLDVSSASINTLHSKAVQRVSFAQCEEQLQRVLPEYTLPVRVSQRRWQFIDPKYKTWSPVRLFLLFFQPVLELLLFHTNIKAHRKQDPKQAWKDVTTSDLKRRLAIRVELADHKCHR